MENLQSEKERMLWKEAKKRVGFRYHLYSYLIVNAMMWVMWLLNGKPADEDHNFVPWPLFCTLGWGFGLFWHFMGAYVFNKKVSAVEKEFEKLKSRNEAV
jgi:hypothetical protein